MTALQYLKHLKREDQRAKYPNIKPEYIVTPQYTDKTANGLTRCIIDFLKLSGCQAERINTTGRPIDTTQTFTDSVGFKRTIGGVKWVKCTTTRGSADISATIRGKSVKIEVKIGKDRMSAAQQKYQQDIERAGGVYYVARTFEEFYQWFYQYIQIN